MSILLTLILLSNLVLICLLLLFARKVRVIYEDFQNFVRAPDEKTPSELAKLCIALSDLAAQSLMAQVKTTLMGLQSGVVRSENAAENELAESLIGKANPLAGLLMQLIPKAWKRKIVKHPELVDAVTSRFGNRTPVESGSNGHHEQVQFKL